MDWTFTWAWTALFAVQPPFFILLNAAGNSFTARRDHNPSGGDHPGHLQLFVLLWRTALRKSAVGERQQQQQFFLQQLRESDIHVQQSPENLRCVYSTEAWVQVSTAVTMEDETI